MDHSYSFTISAIGALGLVTTTSQLQGSSDLRGSMDSIATNPEFSFVAPRFTAAYGETVFPVLFFIDGRVSDAQLNLTVALVDPVRALNCPSYVFLYLMHRNDFRLK